MAEGIACVVILVPCLQVNAFYFVVLLGICPCQCCLSLSRALMAEFANMVAAGKTPSPSTHHDPVQTPEWMEFRDVSEGGQPLEWRSFLDGGTVVQETFKGSFGHPRVETRMWEEQDYIPCNETFYYAEADEPISLPPSVNETHHDRLESADHNTFRFSLTSMPPDEL